jgi:hypothetical protein
VIGRHRNPAIHRTGQARTGSLASLWDGAHTVLTGSLDRSALYSVLAQIEALGLDLLEVRQLTPERKSPEPGDSRFTVMAARHRPD